MRGVLSHPPPPPPGPDPASLLIAGGRPGVRRPPLWPSRHRGAVRGTGYHLGFRSRCCPVCCREERAGDRGGPVSPEAVGCGRAAVLGDAVDGMTQRTCPSHPNRWNCALLLSNAARIPFATGGPSGARTENATADHPGQNGPGQQNGIASDVRINTLHFFLARTGTDTDGLVMRRSGVRVPKAAHSLTSTYV